MRLIPYLLCCTLLTSQAASAGLRDWLNDFTSGRDDSQQQTSNSGLSDDMIGEGLKQALAVGSERAIALLSKRDGYLGEQAVRIALPDSYQSLAKGLRTLGQGRLVDDFEVTMNRAAEQAIGETLVIVRDTVTAMSWQDVREVLSGGDDAATRYLQEKAGERMQAAVLPLVADATEKTGATRAFKRMQTAISGRRLGKMLKTEALDLDSYVTDKALQGFFLKLAEEEGRIRQDPLARSTELLKQVFEAN